MKKLFAAACLAALVAMPAAGRAEDITRFAPLKAEELSPAQKAWADMIAAPPRNAKFGTPPYRAYIRNPELAPRLSALSEYLRWNTSLPPRLSEMAILITARQWTAQYEWFAHYPLALKAGLDPKICGDISAGQRPDNMRDDEAALYDLATALYRDKKVTDPVYKAARRQIRRARRHGYHRHHRLLRSGLDDADHHAGGCAERQRAAAAGCRNEIVGWATKVRIRIRPGYGCGVKAHPPARVDSAAIAARRARRPGGFPARGRLAELTRDSLQDPDHRLEFFQENRPGEIIALRVADLGGGLQISQLLEGFDAFGDHGHAERFAQRFDRPQDALAARALMDVGDEGAVDLDLVGGDIGQRRQRRIADAEIVDRNSDPELAEDRQDLGPGNGSW